MTLTANDKKTLRRIREKVVSTHWIKSEYYRVLKSGPNKGKEMCCLVGLVNVETLSEDNYTRGDYGRYGSLIKKKELIRRDRILNELRDAASEHTHQTFNVVESFNDAQETKRQDVLDVIDIALGVKK